MVKYAKEPEDTTKSCKARGSDLRTHFKNMREAAGSIKGKNLGVAKQYLEDVLSMKRCIVFRRQGSRRKGDYGGQGESLVPPHTR